MNRAEVFSDGAAFSALTPSKLSGGESAITPSTGGAMAAAATTLIVAPMEAPMMTTFVAPCARRYVTAVRRSSTYVFCLGMDDEPEPAKSNASTWNPLAARAVPYGSHSHRLPSLWCASTTPDEPVPRSTAARLRPAPLVSRIWRPRCAWVGHSAPTGGSVGPGLTDTVGAAEFPGAGGGGAE